MSNLDTILQENILLKNHTTVGIGGPARYFLEVTSQDELIKALRFAQKKNLPYLIIGGGSNLLISDTGFSGLVIKNNIQGIKISGNRVMVDSGTHLQYLISTTILSGLAGLQKLTGIPGTLGGAIFGNAGAYSQTISDYITKVACLDPQTLQISTLPKDECGFDYRDSAFKRNKLIIMGATFELPNQDSKLLQEQSKEILKQRLLKYAATIKCPGSFFKNILLEKISQECLSKIPPEKIISGKIPAGYLLECTGAKGERLGQVEVSTQHGNLIINKGGATSADFYKLTQKLAQRVKGKFGIELEPEVQLINLSS